MSEDFLSTRVPNAASAMPTPLFSAEVQALTPKKTVRRGRAPKAKVEPLSEQETLPLPPPHEAVLPFKPAIASGLSAQEPPPSRRPLQRKPKPALSSPSMQEPLLASSPSASGSSALSPLSAEPEAPKASFEGLPLPRANDHPSQETTQAPKTEGILAERHRFQREQREGRSHFRQSPHPQFQRHPRDTGKKYPRLDRPEQRPQQHARHQPTHTQNHSQKDFHKKNFSQRSQAEQAQGQNLKKPFTKEQFSSKGGDPGGLRLGRLPFKESLKSIEALDYTAQNTFNPDLDPLDFNTVYNYTLLQLVEELKARGLGSKHLASRKPLLDAWLAKAFEEKRPLKVSGLLEMVHNQGDAILVYAKDNYHTQALNTFIPQAFVKAFMLKKGQEVEVLAVAPSEDHSCLVALDILSVMGRDPAENLQRVPFTELVPYYPLERIFLETNNDERWDNLSMRTLDLLTPIGFGQRGLIVAPPRTGKTVLLQAMANAIAKNYPKAHLLILLVDERPEEVTDFKRHTPGEVIYSTFDADAQSHVHVAEMVIEKARALVEIGKDVVILLDSITRLARAYNSMVPSTGKILSGGIESNALQGPKRLFGSARNIEEGGSLTIIGSALVETGSKMDEVIFEEFKGTGNMELHLDRGLSDKRIFPAISFERSGTRKEELLYHKDELAKIRIIRRSMKGLPSNEAMEMFIQKVGKTPNNASFLVSLK